MFCFFLVKRVEKRTKGQINFLRERKQRIEEELQEEQIKEIAKESEEAPKKIKAKKTSKKITLKKFNTPEE